MPGEVTLDGLHLMLVQLDGKLGVLTEKLDQKFDRLSDRQAFAEKQTEQRILATEQKASFTESRLEARVADHETQHKAADVVLNDQMKEVTRNVDSLRLWRAKIAGIAALGSFLGGGAVLGLSEMLK